MLIQWAIQRIVSGLTYGEYARALTLIPLNPARDEQQPQRTSQVTQT